MTGQIQSVYQLEWDSRFTSDLDWPSGSETRCHQRWCWPAPWCHPWNAPGSGSSWATRVAQWSTGGGWCSSPAIEWKGVKLVVAEAKLSCFSAWKRHLPWVQRRTKPAAGHLPSHCHCSPPTEEPTLHGRASVDHAHRWKDRGQSVTRQRKQKTLLLQMQNVTLLLLNEHLITIIYTQKSDYFQLLHPQRSKSTWLEKLYTYWNTIKALISNPENGFRHRKESLALVYEFNQ